MPDDLPYMLSIRNLNRILTKIKTAGTPPKFTVDFLKTALVSRPAQIAES